ncbi:glycosyltransferase family 4 protein [Flavobacteriales bacterium]|nr:glycosyltransferase family 4 protein [Flavobacteriales bacterium]
MSKIKVFLGGYINYTNAQNLNCRAIGEHLNKDKFEVYALKVHFGDNEKYSLKSFNCFKPFSITQHLGFLWGILHCDVAYFSKHVFTPLWILKLSKLLKKPIFTTIEGNVTDLSKPNLIGLFRSQQKMKNHFTYFNAVFGITQQLINSTHQVIKMRKSPLFLGVDLKNFSPHNKEKLDSIVFVGGLIKRKRVYELITLAKLYPNIQFKIIGEGSEQQSLQNKAPLNVSFFGKLNHNEMDAIFSSSDLLFLPSKSEGFPKVILEAASAGISSVVYNTYGASNWINDRENGFIVNDFNEVKSIVNELLNDSILLQSTSEGAVKLAQKFDWRNIILDWEKVIVDLQNGK